MISIQEFVAYTNSVLKIDQFSDFCPNGLQVEGKSNIQVVVSGVTASKALLEAAIAENADAILVHHGYFWKNENPAVVGMKRQRLQLLLNHQINLLAYHLPLDAHLEYGNNTCLARELGFTVDGVVTKGPAKDLLFFGKPSKTLSLTAFGAELSQVLAAEPLLIAGSEQPIQRIAWCTGAAQGFIEQAAEMGVDAYLSGEVSEQTTHVARELGVHYIAAGHHATERYGIKCLGEHLSEHFGLKHIFIDIDNPA